MNQLLEYRVKLVNQLETAAEEFRAACLAVQNPFQAINAEGWNVHQVAAHTRDVEELVYGPRIRRTAEEDEPAFPDFDGDGWMAEHYNPAEPLASILEDVSASVQETVSLLRDLPSEAWSRESSHEVYGSGFTLQTWAERSLAHMREHSKTVQKAS